MSDFSQFRTIRRIEKKHQLYMSRGIVNEVPGVLQQKIWQIVARREQANDEDYLYIFNIDIHHQRAVIRHTQEVPVFKCNSEIECASGDAQFKIYVIRDYVLDESIIYTMLFANEY